MSQIAVIKKVIKKACSRKLFPKCTCKTHVSDCPVHPGAMNGVQATYAQTYDAIFDEYDYKLTPFPDAETWINEL